MKIVNKRILITGGSGFIGTNLIDSFVKDGIEIVNIDKVQPNNKSHIKYWRSIDILNYNELEKVISDFNPHIIIHLAAVTDLNGKDLAYYDANIRGTENIIKICDKLPHLQKVMFTSSMYVCQPGFIPPDFETYKPHTRYGESKVKGELLVKEIKNPMYEWVIIRPTSIWGPWFNIPYIDFFNIVFQGKYYDFGKACTKTYGYVGNTVFQIRRLVDSNHVHGKTFYLGDFEPIQISKWANEISIAMSKGSIKTIPFPILKGAAYLGDILSKLKIKFPITSFRLANMTTNNILPLDNLYEIIGDPPFSRQEGIQETIQWLIEHKNYEIAHNKHLS